MSTGLELLELAAKAAGIVVVRSRLDDPFNKDMLVNASPRNPFQNSGAWNPLSDDGDALRLAVNVRAFGHPDFIRQLGAARFELQEQDDAAAYRLAIVRVAAEIGSTS